MEQGCMMPSLYHFSATPIGELTYQEQGDEDGVKSFLSKPRGLWVTTDTQDGWEDWCRSNDFRFGDLKVKTKVILKREAKILYLSKSREIRSFHKNYRTLPSFVIPGMDIKWQEVIDWKKVASRYQGIVIAPYQYVLRFEMSMRWYTTWDCASGCIWDPEAIEKWEVENVQDDPQGTLGIPARQV